MAVTAARYTRQETLLALLLRYCPIFSVGWSASVFPLKPRILELRRPSRYMEASYMEARVYFYNLFQQGDHSAEAVNQKTLIGVRSQVCKLSVTNWNYIYRGHEAFEFYRINKTKFYFYLYDSQGLL